MIAPHLGALVHLTLPDGSVCGRDEHRLDVMSGWMRRNRNLLDGKRVLDLGSNTGHFPIVMAQLGARVVSVEPDPKNLAFFADLLAVYEFGQPEIEILERNLRDVDYAAEVGSCDVLSTLGLIYHMNRPWQILDHVLKATGASLWLLESSIWPEISEVWEGGNGCSDRSFSQEFVLHPTAEEVERGIRECGFVPERVDLGPDYRSEDKTPRGFWMATKA